MEGKIRDFTRDEMRKMDEISINQLEIVGILLMENAGLQSALFLRELLLKKENKYHEFGDYRQSFG